MAAKEHVHPHEETEEFSSYLPTRFNSSETGERAEEWIERIEQIFVTAPCARSAWLRLATFQLSRNVLLWWQTTKAGLRAQGRTVDWDVFRSRFLDKHFSIAARQKKEREFEDLRQGSMSVAEYESRYSALLKYVSHVATNVHAKMRHFLRGLKLELFDRVQSNNPVSFDDAVTRAEMAELVMQEQCTQIEITCFECGGVGHIARQCPSCEGQREPSSDRDRSSGRGGRKPQQFTPRPSGGQPRIQGAGPPQAHVYALTREQAEEAREKMIANEKERWTFYGKGSRPRVPLVSAIRISRLLEHGHEGYLIYAVDVTEKKKEVGIEEIPIVAEFVDVFLDEIPGFPPAREVEFGIELVPGTSPISCTPYRMAPAELRELKAQLQDLLNKGYIRHSVSPWGVRLSMQGIYVQYYRLADDGNLRMNDRWVIPDISELRQGLLRRANFCRYSIHPGDKKMYKDLRSPFWWKGMNRDVIDFVRRCLNCQQIKAERRRSGGELRSLEVPT
ncbi:uncharacterized protein LOC142538482 [Primulina tabacum]|uniref:uncharacterized protein LOC142538482 n=1 Tax=Primulina tabacum TaxID=48773 RepID=UPI003F5A9969